MLEISPQNAVEYLHDRGWLDRRIPARAEVLAWGVSNAVLRVTPAIGEALVVKQSRAQLRTKDPWFSRLDRIYRETDAMRVIQPLLPEGVIPRVLFEDRENYLFGMQAAPAAHSVWKQLLLEGRADSTIAGRLGAYLATIHRQTADQPQWQSQFGDTEVFVQLRVDPFYRRIAEASAVAAPHIECLIAEMFSLPICLVHADFSPKNVLVAGERIVLVDFETAHYGDPAFDLGFFLSHLLLKAIRHAPRFTEYAALTNAFWETYLAGLAALSHGAPFAPVEILRRTTGHVAGCMWARIDGTSRVDYLVDPQQQAVREFCLALFCDPPADWFHLLARLKAILGARHLDLPAAIHSPLQPAASMSNPISPARITRVHAREVFDSRGRPTVEVEVTCASGHVGRAMAPSGASKGHFEALELRDGDETRLNGTGVLRAVANVNSVIAPALVGRDATDQGAVDQCLSELDGTQNCSRLGANAMVAVSLATAHAAAAAQAVSLVEHLHELWRTTGNAAGRGSRSGPSGDRPAPPRTASLGDSFVLPLPMVNMISGGLHAGRNLDLQDFLILPVGAASFHQALEWVVTVYHRLGALLQERGFEGMLVGDEGGYGPRLKTNRQALDMLVTAIDACHYRPGADVAIGLDVAATHLTCGGGYRLALDGPDKTLSSQAIIDLFDDWTRNYPIVSIEDPLEEGDESGWRAATQRLGNRVQLIGDDLFVTNPGRFRRLAAEGLANSVLIKVNQIGTLSETFATMRLALEADYWPVVSARSGETEDATIADLAVATGAGQIKIGSVARSERLAKYNQLLRLEERLGSKATWLGGQIFAQFRVP